VASAGGGGSSSHSNVAGGTQTNGPSVAVDLSEAALEQAIIDIAAFTDDRGLKIAVRPQTLIIPVNLMFEATRILKGDWQVNSAERNVNALKTMGMVPEIVVNHYLTDTDAWFLRTDARDGMLYFSRRDDEFSTDDDFDTENAKFKATFRCSFGWGDWRGIYGSPGV
jgi:phage major head subunit gpT-like protein